MLYMSSLTAEPKLINHEAGVKSDNYGQIPRLRTPIKLRRRKNSGGMRKYANTIMHQRKNSVYNTMDNTRGMENNNL